MDFDTIKLLIAILCAVVSFFVAVVRNRPFLFNKPGIGILLCLATIAVHYYIVEFSIDAVNTQSLIFATSIWLAALMAMSAFGPEYLIDSTAKFVSWMLYPATAFLGYLLLSGNGTDPNGYFIGITSNPNIMGGYLVLFMFPFALQKVLNASDRGWLLALDTTILVLILSMVYLTGSRGAVLAVGIPIVYVALVSRNLNAFFKIIIVCSVIAAPFLMQEFFIKYGGTSLFSTREYLVMLRIEAISERPWFGWGLAADVNNSFDETNIFPPQEKGNTFLQFLEEFGFLIGLPLFLMMTALCVSVSLKLRHQRNKVWLIVFILAALVHSMGETWMLNFKSLLAIAFWVLLLLGGALVSTRKEAMKQLQHNRPATLNRGGGFSAAVGRDNVSIR